MSWLFSQALVEEYLGASYLDGEQSVPLNGKSIQQAYCAPDKMTKFCRLSRFGMMFKPLTESLGEELLMLYLGDFHAKILAQPEGGGGITGSRSSMWKHMARIIGEVQPKYCFVENSPMLTNRGLGAVLGDLAELGFNAEWGVLSAADVGANHLRERIWIVGKNMAYSKSKNVGLSSKRTGGQKKHKFRRSSGRKDEMANAIGKGLQRGLHRWQDSQWKSKLGHFGCSSSTHGQSKQGWWSSEPNVGRVANGVANRVDRLKAIGNGQVPLCAAIAWRLLKERLDGHKQRGVEKHLRG